MVLGDSDSPKDSRLATSMLCHAGRPSYAKVGRLAKVAYRIEGVPTKSSIGETMALLGGRIVGRPKPQSGVPFESDENCVGHDLAAEPIKTTQTRVQMQV